MPDIHFKTEAEAVAYLTARWPNDDIASYVAAARQGMVDSEEDPDRWWADISGPELVEWIGNLL